MYAALMPTFTYIMLKRGLRTRMQKFLFWMSLFMFLLATIYWALSFWTFIKAIQITFFSPELNLDDQFSILPMWSAIILLNYVLTDGVVVWKAWVLCQDQSKKVLWFAIFFLICSACSVLATIILRLLLYVTQVDTPIYKHLTRAIDVIQVANLVLSSLTNVVSTSTVAVKTWRIRRQIKERLSAARNRRSAGTRVMVLLVESGIIYCLSCITVLIATVVPLEVGTLGDIYTPVNVQLAGMYPVAVLLLVSGEYSMEPEFFSGSTVGSERGNRESGVSVRAVDRYREVSRLESIRFRTVGTIEPGEDSTDSESEQAVQLTPTGSRSKDKGVQDFDDTISKTRGLNA
ncbi:hypothetical protein K435DRAFT_767657 [Dendrothele bispora CBS 962.96]|uniref:Uncharacterized protein n=1 Tax=Dendrothele bispora (strain CBS 962.96) TaxID=1314807 RepID=A0A4V4HBW1_DENBC|nr:hypothetical protein K435DRAFT_767657 [Dendrothele bispora CBS 962.96]